MRQLKLVRSQEEKRRAAQMEARAHTHKACLLAPACWRLDDVAYVIRVCRKGRRCRQARRCGRPLRLVATTTAAMAAAAAGRLCRARRPGRARRSTTAAAAGRTALRELCRALATTCDSRWDRRGVTEAAAAPGEASSTSCHRCAHTPNVTHARACCVCVADVCVAVFCVSAADARAAPPGRARDGRHADARPRAAVWRPRHGAALGRPITHARNTRTHTYVRRAHKTTWNNERRRRRLREWSAAQGIE
jgi:hypothetical protein